MRSLIALFFVVLLGFTPAVAQQDEAVVVYESGRDNDVGSTRFVLYQSHRFSISTDWLETDDGPAYSTQFSGTYREWPNVYDLHFERMCVNEKKCHKPTAKELQTLFYNSTEVGVLRDDVRTYRLNKNPQKLYLSLTLMERVK